MAKKRKAKHKLRVIATRDIKIEDLIIEDRFREPTGEDIEMLAESLKEFGQVRESTVRKHPDMLGKYRVVAGATLVKAAEKLGWLSVRADIVKCTDAQARRWEVAENLFRHQHSPMEESEHIAEFMRTFDEEAGPEKKLGKSKPGRPEGAISKAARKLSVKGKTHKARRKRIERGLKIASMTPEAKAAAKKAGTDSWSALGEIADEDTAEGQLAKVQEIAKGKASSKRKKRKFRFGKGKSKKKNTKSGSGASLSPKDKKALAKLIKAWNKAARLKREFAKASQAVRDKFIEGILQSASSEEDELDEEDLKSKKKGKKKSIEDDDDDDDEDNSDTDEEDKEANPDEWD